MKPYGKELILDMHDCDPNFMNRVNIKIFMDTLCKRIKMQQCDLHFWDYEGEEEEYEKAPEHLKGVSAIQFITTSNITIHTLDKMNRVYLNIYSCKSFKSSIVKETAIEFFKGNIVNAVAVTRI
ncbi:unnamed protein product [marine sediment metagenome]|uniref:S-adenosylmethionine decarboxylase proenzyme n=1 Tax=marine sediment metagenome TaxID=412755 RepID=X0UMQ3_9ZZZZ